MSANIFRMKINSFDIKNINSEALIDYCFEMPRLDFNFKNYVELLSMEVDKEESPRHFTYTRFSELLKVNHKKFGDDFFAPLLHTYEKEFQNLKESYLTNNVSVLSHPIALIWNNILAELNVDDFKPFPVLELNIELAQDHDGILAFPDHRGLGINSIVYREFMIRVLVDLQEEIGHSSEIINEWFKSRNGDLYPNYPDRISYGKEELNFDGDEGIVWGIKETNEIIIELDDTTFPDKYAGAWWLERINSSFAYWKKDYPEWAEANKEYPFKIKTFSILVHPAWFSSLIDKIDIEQIYDSSAYGW